MNYFMLFAIIFAAGIMSVQLRGKKESLNAAVAFGIAAYRLITNK